MCIEDTQYSWIRHVGFSVSHDSWLLHIQAVPRVCNGLRCISSRISAWFLVNFPSQILELDGFKVQLESPYIPISLVKKPHILGKNHVKTMASTFFHIFPFVSSGNINPLVPGSSLGTTPPAPAGAQLELPTSRELSFLGVPWMRTGTGGPL